MATKISLRVSLLVLLVVLYLDCSLQGAQASPTGNILPTWAKKGLGDPEGHLAEKIVSVFKGNSTGVPRANIVELEYAGHIPPLNEIKEAYNYTLAVTYPGIYIIEDIEVLTEWYTVKGTLVLSDGGLKYNYWALTWTLPPRASVDYDVIVTVITL
jgi:hypothetical protein